MHRNRVRSCFLPSCHHPLGIFKVKNNLLNISKTFPEIPRMQLPRDVTLNPEAGGDLTRWNNTIPHQSASFFKQKYQTLHLSCEDLLLFFVLCESVMNIFGVLCYWGDLSYGFGHLSLFFTFYAPINWFH